MSENSYREYVVSRVQTTMSNYDSNIPMGYPNVRFDPPENILYGQCFLLGGRSINSGKKGTKVLVRYTGVLQVTFFSPDETGSKNALLAIDAIIKAFNNHQGRDSEGVAITFKTAETRYPTGEPRYQKQYGGWFQTIVRIPYYRDEYEEVTSAT